jgi:carbonic anhydrase/acetyltransferase-like protein (isoleucine patch superfamily)
MAIYALGDAVPTIDPTAYVHPDAVVIGEVTLGPQSSIWPGAVLRADHGQIIVGARTSIQDGSVLHTTEQWPTVVGDECVVGHLVHLEGCTVGNRVLVGSGCIMLNRSGAESLSVVGAGALVPEDMQVPRGHMALGVPAKLRQMPQPEQVDEWITYGVDWYCENAARFAKDLRRLD